MAKIEITHTELVWPGKYDENGRRQDVERARLPFQVIERINESRATHEANKLPKQPSLFDIYEAKEGDTYEDGWRNKLIWGDNLLVMGSLLENFAGKIDLIYIDPPFATGADFSFQVEFEDESFTRKPSIIEQKAYRDTWGRGLDSYLQWFYETVILLRELLSEDGSIYVHLDWHVGHYAKAVMDEIFGTQNFRNEIIREKSNPKNYTKLGYGNVHDVILFYSKTEQLKWIKPYIERNEAKITVDFPLIDKQGRRYKTAPLHAPGMRSGESGRPWRNLMPPGGNHWRYVHATLDQLDADGRIEWSSTGNPREIIYAHESQGIFLQDIWLSIKDAKGDYPSMKNPEILERIIGASSAPNDLVFDCFCGSGTTAAVSEKLGRRWITCDLGRFAIHTTRKQLLGIGNCKPFEILVVTL